MFSFLKRIFGTAQSRTLAKFAHIVKDINRIEEGYKTLSDDALKAKTTEFRERYAQGQTLDALLPEAYAVVKNCCRRFCGQEVHVSGYNQKWDMIPFDEQMLGAIALHKGYIAEMQTGEGKTLTAAMPLYLNALTGKPVHIVTTNDYLANRDCEWVGAIQRWLGLTTGVLLQDASHRERKAAYACDIVYGTASEFGFDYLRDNSMATRKEEEVQRGFYFALIDEVDSILIDEARTPLIISGPANTSRQLYDILKEPVNMLVFRQNDLCNRLALQAKKALGTQMEGDEKKQLTKEDKEAFRLLWLVSKGAPRNRVLKRAKENPDFRAAIDTWDLYYYAEQNKEEKAKALQELFIIVDEKANEYELTDKGIQAWKDCGGKEDDFVMLDLGHAFAEIDNEDAPAETKMTKKLACQEEDALRKERAHNLRQLLRAHLLMERDVDYIIQDKKIVIIDENTGRAQPGRRFSDGLHQAIEAKEDCPIQRETQTFATITLQNYFRMYEKLAGMTGTAITEAQELKEIYKLDVLQIPTHKVMIRHDANDEMYMTEREKYNAILKEVKEQHAKGRPILIGTESVDVSEKLSRIFKFHQLEHTVLNAKNNAREAEIIAAAGKPGAITVSTNMAGRGTDIKLGPGIAELGGLHVIGSTRHQSRRIDRQLRGRSGRQGDLGSSKFFLSLEDPLMRLFSSPTITSLLQRYRPPEGEPISASILNKSIETAQKRIEQRNYTIRKHTLEYDDVMNRQRQEIYAFRHSLIHTDDVFQVASELFQTICTKAAEIFFVKRGDLTTWNPQGFSDFLVHHLPVTFDASDFDDDTSDAAALAKQACERIRAAFHGKIESEKEHALIATNLALTQTQTSPETITDAIQAICRRIMIHTIDTLWQEHLLAMDHLRSDVHMRAVGQKDPLMEFKHEAFHLFDAFTQNVRLQMAKGLFRFHISLINVTPRAEGEEEEYLEEQELFEDEEPNIEEKSHIVQLETARSLVSELENEMIPMPPSIPTGTTFVQPPVTPITIEPKIGRNDPCPCGSGKKYKKCCGEEGD